MEEDEIAMERPGRPSSKNYSGAIGACLSVHGRAVDGQASFDQGSQFTSHDWQGFLRDNLASSMSGRGNCHDNAVAKSFFQLLTRERIRRQNYSTRDEARADVFIYIEMFYNPRRRHNTAGDLSPVEFEQRCFQRLKSV
jgi:putative transposase